MADHTTWPSDLFVQQQQFTKTVYRDQYSAIDPASSKLSQKGRNVIISGATQGIGKGIALGFAKAKPAALVLVGRNAKNLVAVKEEVAKISPSTVVLTCPTDITDAAAVQTLFENIGSELQTVDVLINNAGSWGGEGPVGTVDAAKWWCDFEVGVKGNFLMTQGFLKLVGTERPASIVNVSSFGACVVSPGASSYALTKFAATRLTEFVDAENANIQAISYHPGTIETPMTDNHEFFRHFSRDTYELAAGAAVYLSLPEAKYLSGRYVSANWDFDELKSKEEEVVSNNWLKFELKGEFGAEQFQK